MTRPLRARLLDAAGRPEVRGGADSGLTLTVVNQAAAALTRVRVEFSLAPLFADPRRQRDVRVDAPAGWTAAYAEDRQAWVLSGGELAAGAELAVTITGARPDIPIGQALLPLVVTGGDGPPRRATIPLTVMPSGEPQRDLLDALGARLVTRRPGGGVAAPEVAVTRRAGEVERSDLALWLYNRTGRPLVSDPWGPWPPTITLVFDAADGPPGHGALTTSRQLDDVEVVVERGSGWRVVKRSPGPEWDLVAVPVGGTRSVLAAGAFTELSIRGIATDFAPGPTLAELRWHGFPGFSDGVRTFVVDKHCPPMRIARPLQANDDAVDLVPGAGVELAWKVEHASLVQLSGVGEVPSESSGFPVAVPRDTVFVLTAYDAMLGAVLTDQIEIKAATAAGEPLSTALLPAGAIVAWEGEEPPEGFALCDGTRGTPDLRGRFVRGAGRTVKPGERGGGGRHTHAFAPTTVEGVVATAGEHRHGPPDGWSAAAVKRGRRRRQPATGVADGEAVTTPDGAHTHELETLALVVEVAESDVPWPHWHALTYVMKL